MLLQNPQLAYALLQALVVMKVVDPAEATVSPSLYWCAIVNARYESHLNANYNISLSYLEIFTSCKYFRKAVRWSFAWNAYGTSGLPTFHIYLFIADHNTE